MTSCYQKCNALLGYNMLMVNKNGYFTMVQKENQAQTEHGFI